MPYRRSGRGREAHPEGQKWSGGHPGGLGGPPNGLALVENSTRWAKSGREALPEG